VPEPPAGPGGTRPWPHQDHSRHVAAGELLWHVQRMGPAGAPAVLLLHGTGASCHTWRGLLPLLARQFDTLAVDLPGHARTSTPRGRGLSLPGMARALAALMEQLPFSPALLVGHSAGAAIALRMVLSGLAAPRAVVSINGALLPLHGLAGQVFSPLAKLLALNPLVPRLFSWRAADPRVLRRLIAGTGSTLDTEGLELYRRLVSDPVHAAGALGMMAQWDLQPLAAELPRLSLPLELVVGSRDRTLPPGQAARVQTLVPQARLTTLEGLGHLAHEEQPALAHACILRAAVDAGVLDADPALRVAPVVNLT
jgi:magnesium chelatase accessory protein